MFDFIKRGIKILKNPEKEFGLLEGREFEEVIFDYLKLLIFWGVISAIFNFLLSLIKIFYLDLFLAVEIDYPRFLNFVMAQSSTVVIIYAISGTILMYFLSLILKVFFRKIKYTELMKRMTYSVTPILFFGWTPRIAMALIVWTIFLFLVGTKYHKGDRKVSRKSIEQRY